MDSGKDAGPNFGVFTPEDYISKINTPAQNPEYFKRFHLPLIKNAKKNSPDGKITLLDVACGYAFELDPLRDDPAITLLGIDIARDVLAGTRKRFGANRSLFVQADVEDPPLAENVADAGIALNAVGYKPEHVLGTLYRALKPGRRCAVNFRVYGNPYNQAFYDYYRERGATLSDQELDFHGLKFRLTVLNYATYRGENEKDTEQIRNLDRQVYFQSVKDIKKLVKAVGFKIVKHNKFHFASTANPDNEIDVYTLQKPTPDGQQSPVAASR